ncbi:isoleucine patch superfamily enzyme, carbonic anhydrase/acetyltransferase [Marinitoga piezophila KA3]|uniref:Isoleucine patch superfamily enzyme, carbonic anhydrase/acetyltransferase n=1 Tax=Marinitoga piezophila (strain DSM 14283 / JCM 11233 / KA3) TaxID=443254 RepID=H2J8B7_MARPK|nr:acyltransferase [Marinitoga piezophila]AEX85601.1 isoleucine patch superfamily enzyme, carbonic anhydrase/acetyltransferase [Marinitoga piezophila KA3]
MRRIIMFLIFLKYKFKLRKKVKFYGTSIIFEFPESKIEFGNNIEIKNRFDDNYVGLNHKTIIIARDGGKITIGNNVGISGSVIYSLKEIKIGNNVLIGANCKIIDHDFHPLEPKARIEDNREKIRRKSIIIKDNVYIGTNSIILRGSEIGKNCIVGAGSVVSGKFPDNCVIAGNPAKIIRYLTEGELEQ